MGDVEMAARWPGLWLRVERALTALGRGCRPLACRHVIDGGGWPCLCAEHPAAGILCGGCAARHLARHSGDVEARCDECGRVVDGIWGLTSVVEAGGLRAGDTTGRHRPLWGPLLVTCVGICGPCRGDAA